jgi:putative aminopeptidase FrvX
MTEQSAELLSRLIAAHSTPGDESQVAAILTDAWRQNGWQITKYGSYAISASRRSLFERRRPRMLICAHMDSPGFIVVSPAWSFDEKSSTATVRIVTLGQPAMEMSSCAGRIKCRNGFFKGTIQRAEDGGNGELYLFETTISEARKADLCTGDRVCFQPRFTNENGIVSAPFLDNRLGCWMLAELAALPPGWNRRYEVVLGATGSEEMTGHGAQILAAQLQADLIVVLDATYVTETQGVKLGGGAVVTLSDKAVLLAPAMRDRISHIMQQAEVPIQFEAYNYSGTDARAWPSQGSPATVIALLIPTNGNHTPCEQANVADLINWQRAVLSLEKLF